MDEADYSELQAEAAGVLERNNRGQWTIPAENLYPHQWLWDSCFIVLGLRHLDIERAKAEILHLLGGQWSNGMVPHMIFASGDQHRRDRELWRSYLSPYAPDHVYTSGLTQPPLLAEAVVRIGAKLDKTERRSWYGRVLPALVRYHQWLYTERDPHNEGLIVNIHPYETGLDNSPPWISILREHNFPLWIRFINKTRLEPVVNLLRRDIRYVPPGQRMSTIEAMAYFAALRRLRAKAYDSDKILSRSLFAVEDIVFNSIAVRANHLLKSIAKAVNKELPESLLDSFKKADGALDELWDAHSGQYYCRNFVTHKLIRESTIGTLMPLYAGTISKDRAAELVNLLKDGLSFGLKHPVPTVPKNSSYFNPVKYWQGPAWLNTNWMIVDGLKRYGYKQEAETIRSDSLELVKRHSCYEYFSPIDGAPAGAAGFSWTAAIVIDWLNT